MLRLRIWVPLAAGLLFVSAACDRPLPPATESPLFSHANGVATGLALLHPVNRSDIIGVVEFTDDGSTLTVNGVASGLDPGAVYVSLIYDNGSVSGGPEACEPTIFDPSDPDFILLTMFVGVWDVDAAGNGTLEAENILDEDTGERVYVPLSKFKTISIRDTRINEGFGPEAVVACGDEATHPAG